MNGKFSYSSAVDFEILVLMMIYVVILMDSVSDLCLHYIYK